MKISNFFLPILREDPSDAQIISHKLMLKSGMIRQSTSGIYNWLPLGVRVLTNISNLIRNELDKIGAQEVLMSTIQPASLWKESGRFEAYGKEMLKIKDRHNVDLLYGPTNEEIIVDIFRNNIISYKNLPKIFYQLQWKFRDEIRPRFGIMRGREFFMKDAYSFDINSQDARETYYKMFESYIRIFRKMNLKIIPVQADTGPIGGDLSHEFHVVAENGESQIYYDKKLENIDILPKDMLNLYAVADEKYESQNCPLPQHEIFTKRGIEVGHIFYLGKKYSEIMHAKIQSPSGDIIPEMGCYGIGVSRLIGAIIEANHDKDGIIWPKLIAPFDISLINLQYSNESCTKICEDLYIELQNKNFKVLYDDNTDRPGSKFATHDLIGIPLQLIIGPKGIANNIIEYKIRANNARGEISLNNLSSKIEELYEKI